MPVVQKKDLIKKLFQEAEVYRSHGLLLEAKAKLGEAAESIRSNGVNTQKQMDIFQAIQCRIHNIEREIARIENVSDYRRIAPQAREVIKKTLSFSNDANASALEGAVALAKFGQVDEAVKEFRRLVTYDHLRFAAAKNIIRCLIASASLESAVSEFREWLSSGSLPPDQLENIRSFLASIRDRKKASVSIPEVFPEPAGIEKKETGAEEEVFIDITSIEFTAPAGSERGRRIELEVGFQNKCILHLIVPEEEQKRIGYLSENDRIDDIRFYSPGAIFDGAAVVVAKSTIEEGPKKGCLAVDLKVVNA